MEISGTQDQQTINLPLSEGRVVQINYPKTLSTKESNKLRRIVRVMFDTIEIVDREPTTGQTSVPI